MRKYIIPILWLICAIFSTAIFINDDCGLTFGLVVLYITLPLTLFVTAFINTMPNRTNRFIIYTYPILMPLIVYALTIVTLFHALDEWFFLGMWMLASLLGAGAGHLLKLCRKK